MCLYPSEGGAHRVPVHDVLGQKTRAMTSRYVGRYVDPLRALKDAGSARIGAALNESGTPAPVVSIAGRKAG
jgi:hypothetical protein